MEEKLKEIEGRLDSLINKVNRIDDWIDNLNEDFSWNFTDFDQSEMFSWFHLAESVERMETILFALNQKFNINADEIDIDLNRKIVDLEVALSKEKKKSNEFSKVSNINLKVKEDATQLIFIVAAIYWRVSKRIPKYKTHLII